MSFLYYLIILLHITACLFLIAVVLLQQGKGQDLASAFGGGGTQAAFGPRGSATVLSRATTILAGVFMVTSLALSLVKPHAAGILDQVQTGTTTASPKPAPVPPASPAQVPGSSAPAGSAPPQSAAPAQSAPQSSAPAVPAEAPVKPANPPAGK
jgi:preprotein translocase subunit SecG